MLRSGIKGYDSILEDAKSGVEKFRPKAGKAEKETKLAGYVKILYFCTPTPGAELQKLMQKKEEIMGPGGRENCCIKIIETAGKT